MMEKNLYPEIPKEKFAFIHKDERIHDEKLQTKSISYLGDAWLRFRKNKSSVVAFCLIVFLLLFAIITPFVHGAVPRRLLQVGAAEEHAV